MDRPEDRMFDVALVRVEVDFLQDRTAALLSELERRLIPVVERVRSSASGGCSGERHGIRELR